MKDLDKSKVYHIANLTDIQKDELFKWLESNDKDWQRWFLNHVTYIGYNPMNGWITTCYRYDFIYAQTLFIKTSRLD